MPASQHSTPTVLVAAVALVAGVAAGTVGTLIVTGSDDSGPNTDATITLPDTLGGMRLEEEVVHEVAGEDNAAALEGVADRERVLAEATEALSDSRDGATAVSARYADDDLMTQVTLLAVAQDSPRLWSIQDTESGPEVLQLATPMEWVVREAEAECLVRAVRVQPAGTDPAEVETTVVRCQQRNPEMTVVLEVNGQMEADLGLRLTLEAAAGVSLD